MKKLTRAEKPDLTKALPLATGPQAREDGAAVSALFIPLAQNLLLPLAWLPPTVTSRLLLQEVSFQLSAECLSHTPQASDTDHPGRTRPSPPGHMTPAAGTMLTVPGSWHSAPSSLGAQQPFTKPNQTSKRKSPDLSLVAECPWVCQD